VLESVHGIREGTLEARALHRDAIEQGQLFVEWHFVLVDFPLADGHARDQPLAGGHLFELYPFRAALRLPLGYELVPELLVFLGSSPGMRRLRERRP